MKIAFGILFTAVMGIAASMNTEAIVHTNSSLGLDKLMTAIKADGESGGTATVPCHDVEMVGGLNRERWCSNCTWQNVIDVNLGTCTYNY